MRKTDQHVGPPESLPTTFDLDGHTYTLPALDTRTLLHSLVLEPPGCWWTLIPVQLADGGGEHLWRRLNDPGDVLDLDQVEHVAEHVLAAVCGVDFHAARRLAQAVWANWFVFDGWCFTRGMRPLDEPVGRVLAASYAWRRSLCSKESELRKLDADIWQPPPATTVSGRPRDAAPASWTDEAEEASFLAAMGNLGAR